MSTYNLNGKFAVVTGAGSGIGHAVASMLLEAGSSVILADLKMRPEAASTVAKYPHPAVTRGASTAVFHKTDVADWAQLSVLWEFALSTFGRIDIVANIAGIYESPLSSFWKPPGLSPQSIDPINAAPGQYQIFAINQAAPIRLSQIALDYWTQNPEVKGNLLCVASMAGYLHAIDTPLYMASKASIVSFVRCLGDLQDLFGIRVSAVCPGAVFTPMFEPEWNRKLTSDDISLSAFECAAVILRVLQEPQWGSGSIVETQMVGTKAAPEIAVRDVPLTALYPTGSLARPNQNYTDHKRRFIAELQNRGMRA
ncbi:putative short chain dehydrogenase/reductase family oxidoreductase [Aspergillus flavus AF70]|nr:putative short chain dehydrogenase/reductase family oxidoreductase [Aspergillus flavus AF70]